MSIHIELDRKFFKFKMDKDDHSDMVHTILGESNYLFWNDLLQKDRIVILGEPGTGKTEEFRSIAKKLNDAGKAAFYCRIELLCKLDVPQTFDIGTGNEFNKWLKTDDEGFFFLDSVDEARLTDHSAFEIALRKFSSSMGIALNRAKIYISSRVSEWFATSDLDIFSRIIPKPTIDLPHKNKEDVVGNATIDHKKEIVFQLAPLDSRQITLFAKEKGIENPKSFIEEVERSDVWIFAERPQDLLNLIGYWKSNKVFSSHARMLDFNIRKKLDEHDPNRDERSPLSSEDAHIGAEILAAAITFQKKNIIILPDCSPDNPLQQTSVNPKEVLKNCWETRNIIALLDRAIFDEAIYGTVQFHHQSVREYLAAKWVKRLLDNGHSRRSAESLFFAIRYGNKVIIPSMRPIVAWLSIWDERIRERVHEIAPEVLIENGDPSMLPIEFRRSLLVEFTKHYAEHSNTGDGSYDITMCRRFVHPELAPTIKKLFEKYSEYNDICVLLLKLIWQGRISALASDALNIAVKDGKDSYIKKCAIRAVAGVIKMGHNRRPKVRPFLFPPIASAGKDGLALISARYVM